MACVLAVATAWVIIGVNSIKKDSIETSLQGIARLGLAHAYSFAIVQGIGGLTTQSTFLHSFSSRSQPDILGHRHCNYQDDDYEKVGQLTYACHFRPAETSPSLTASSRLRTARRISTISFALRLKRAAKPGNQEQAAPAESPKLSLAKGARVSKQRSTYFISLTCATSSP